MADDERPLSAPRGTFDLFPPQTWERLALTRLFFELTGAAGYEPVETPVFEHTEVFERGVGEASEVVTKQMYTFTDLGGRSLTLRPEGTAGVVRAVLERGTERAALPFKLSYAGWMFRQERPQKGRYRQFFQLGIETIGTEDPRADAEVVELGARLLAVAGVEARLLVNSIGHPDASCRSGYVDDLAAFLRRVQDELAPEDRARIATNPLRTFDSKEEATRRALAAAPLLAERLCDACRKHFDEVLALLGDAGVAFELEPRLVRGLDYYTRTAFEFVAEDLGAQATVLAGGRYDGLSEQLGGPRLPGVGFAAGLERMLLASRGIEDAAPAPDVYVVALGERAQRAAFALATSLRAQGLGVLFDLAGRGLKGQLKDAARVGARYAALLGDDELAAGEVTLKDLFSGEQERVAMDELAGRLGR